MTIPLTWFASQVGTRGNMTEVTELKTNQPLAKDFFTTFGINAGKTEAAPGEMKGNVLDLNSSPFGLAIATNWTRKDVEKAGFKTGDKLILLVDEDEYELEFYGRSSEVPPPNELAKGVRLLAPASRRRRLLGPDHRRGRRPPGQAQGVGPHFRQENRELKENVTCQV